MATIKVRRRGEDVELVLPADLVEHLALSDGDELSVTEGLGSVTLRREPTLAEREKAAVGWVFDTHAVTLERLAKR